MFNFLTDTKCTSVLEGDKSSCTSASDSNGEGMCHDKIQIFHLESFDTQILTFYAPTEGGGGI